MLNAYRTNMNNIFVLTSGGHYSLDDHALTTTVRSELWHKPRDQIK